MMRSGNPALGGNVFTAERTMESAGVMTIDGTVNKTFILLVLVVLGAVWTWNNPAGFVPFMWPLLILGFVTAMVTVFKKQWAPVTAPVYAGVEGLILGVISVVFEKSYPGIVIQAVGLTFGVAFSLLMAYKSRMIKATKNFKLGIVAAIGGIAVVYVIDMIMGFFGRNIPFIHNSGMFGIGFSVFVVIIAALNLVLDFDFIEKGAESSSAEIYGMVWRFWINGYFDLALFGDIEVVS